MSTPGFKRSFTYTIPIALVDRVEQEMMQEGLASPQEAVSKLLFERVSTTSDDGADQAARYMMMVKVKRFARLRLEAFLKELTEEVHARLEDSV